MTQKKSMASVYLYIQSTFNNTLWDAQELVYGECKKSIAEYDKTYPTSSSITLLIYNQVKVVLKVIKRCCHL